MISFGKTLSWKSTITLLVRTRNNPMEKLKVNYLGSNNVILECKNKALDRETSAFVSHGEVLEIEEGDSENSEICFEKHRIGRSIQEAMALLILDWPKFYGLVKQHSKEDELWPVEKAEKFAYETKISELSREIKNLTERLKTLKKEHKGAFNGRKRVQ
jgi:hypothetical protein